MIGSMSALRWIPCSSSSLSSLSEFGSVVFESDMVTLFVSTFAYVGLLDSYYSLS